MAFFAVQPHYGPGNDTTRALVASLVEKIDKRKKASSEALSDVICGALALRAAEEFKFNKATLSEDHKKAVDAVKATLIGVLLKREGQYSYSIHPDIDQNTLVVDQSDPNLRFRVQNQWVRWSNSASIPSAYHVGLVSNRHAVVLRMPDVAKTFENLLQGNRLDVRFESVPDIELGLIAEELARQYREEVQFWLTKQGYLAVLIDDNNTDQFTFAVTETHAKDFTEWLEHRTRKWFGSKDLWHLRFYSEVDTRFGYVVKVPGYATRQSLEDNIRSLDASSKARLAANA